MLEPWWKENGKGGGKVVESDGKAAIKLRKALEKRWGENGTVVERSGK